MNTPRTDAFEKQRIVEATTNDIATEAWADFARQLERDLAARNKAYDRVMNNHSVLLCERDSLRRQNERLVSALKEVLASASLGH